MYAKPGVDTGLSKWGSSDPPYKKRGRGEGGGDAVGKMAVWMSQITHTSHCWVPTTHPTVGSLPSIPLLGLYHTSHCWVPTIHPTVGSLPYISLLGPYHTSHCWVPTIHPTVGSLLYIPLLGPYHTSHCWSLPYIPLVVTNTFCGAITIIPKLLTNLN